MSHSFDDQGCKYDADGNNSNWWQESDMARFQAHAEVIKEQFNRYSLHFADGSEEFIRGGLCLGENIADLGGINIAYAAFEDFLKENPLPDVFGFTPQQRFFLGYAQVWRNKETDAYRKVALNNDPHSPPVFRVNGTLSQLPEFARAFHLPKKCPMVISEDKHSRMWNTD
jgi:putative endopeptidase